ncbi:cell wall-associated NlpC family hydrolase [Nocardioides albertanoniae]|uniref:Cell wall-associated NlpC family hydrolase n=1 Tax=Nocardioides albertanoniae TaxID=1175486 RepID=A0A543AAP6_9ACTN|nr:C40 family peptidase [Nocardioides albertanoniae]TQL69671.1 cell wall-associated NlpC family hydrolase [Nocardioides albertanoniae]
MSKSVSRPAHRGAPRPFRTPNVSIARTIAGSLNGHGKLAGRVTLASGIAAGALVAVPAANAAPVTHESTVASATVVEAPVMEPTATPAAMVTDIKQLDRAVDEQQRKAEAARKAAEAKRQAAIAAKKAAEEKKKEEAAAKAYAESQSGKIEKAISVASEQIGDPYVWGATGPDSFDCSGLTQYAYGAAGIELPRVSGAQAGSLPTIPNDQVKRGDLIFFGDPVYHVGIFLRWENGQAIMLHAPKPGAQVREEPAWDGWFAGSVHQAA